MTKLCHKWSVRVLHQSHLVVLCELLRARQMLRGLRAVFRTPLRRRGSPKSNRWSSCGGSFCQMGSPKNSQ